MLTPIGAFIIGVISLVIIARCLVLIKRNFDNTNRFIEKFGCHPGHPHAVTEVTEALKFVTDEEAAEMLELALKCGVF